MSVGIVDLITQFRIQFFDYFPYVSGYVYSLKPVCTTAVDTMAVDKTGNMYWNPEWCKKLTLDQGAYVVQHETWHLILRHCHLSEEILGPNPTPQQLFDMNIAMDCVIWEMLECVKEHAPEGGVTLPNMQERWPQIKSGMTHLEIYSIIQQNKPKLPDEPGQGTPNDGDTTEDESTEGNQGQPEGDSEDEGQGGTSSEQGTEDSEDTGGGGNPGRQGNQSDGERSEGDCSDGQGEGVDGEVQDYGYDKERVIGGSAADGQPRDYEIDDNADAWDAYLEDNLLRQIEKAIEAAEDSDDWIPHSSWGVGKGALKRVIKQKLYPQPDPWKQMAATIGLKVAGVMGQKDDTYQRRNRRQCSVQDGVILKGQQILTPDVVVIMDTSGSMTTQCLNKCSIVCTQGCKAVGQYRLICWDDGLQLDEVVRSNRTEWPTPGGMGTSMEDAIRYALKYKPSVIILCTDGGTCWPEKEELGRCQLIIALTQDMPTPEWAKRVRIPDPGKKVEDE